MNLRARARKRLPNFAFEYVDGGAVSDTGIARNWGAFDSIEMFPRYGKVVGPPPTNAKLFGKNYSAPFCMDFIDTHSNGTSQQHLDTGRVFLEGKTPTNICTLF